MGPSGQLLQRMAKKWDMHVVGTFYAWGTEPNSSDLAYNSGAEPLGFASLSTHPKRAGMGLKPCARAVTAAPFFSRNGTLLGVHNKNMLYVPEEDYGVSPVK